MNIEDYIPYDTPDTPGEADVSRLAVGYPDEKRISKKSPRVLAAEAKDVSELTRKRDILVSVAILGELKSYIGENIEVVQIRKMKKEKLETLFSTYQQKLGQESTNEMMSSLVEMSVKALSYVVDIDNEEYLKNDLVNNKQLRRTLGKQVAGITEKYGDVVAFVKLFFTVGKHVSFSPAEINSASTKINSASTNSDSASTNSDSASTNSNSASTK